MQINIKQLILEGYSFDEITEAVHANHSHLNKNLLKDPNTPYVEGKKIEQNRKKLVDEIKDSRSSRDATRKYAADARVNPDLAEYRNKDANYWDNMARAKSQTGGKSQVYANEYDGGLTYSKMDKITKNIPRIISSAKR